MVTFKGKGASGGIVTGKIKFYRRPDRRTQRQEVLDPEAEVRRFDSAREQAVEELDRLYRSGLSRLGEENSRIFQAHRMMLEDPAYCLPIRELIRRERVNAEYAVRRTTDRLAHEIGREENGYLRTRAADLQDVSARVLAILAGEATADIRLKEPVILAAEDLSPSETVRLDREKVLAFITAGGSMVSHTAILARTMGIPAVIGAGPAVCEELDGCPALIDGFTGEIILSPDEATVRRFKGYEREREAAFRELEPYREREMHIPSGDRVWVRANISTPEELGQVHRCGADGIGLFRSEFLYLLRSGAPSEEEQYAAYRDILDQMGGKRVVIRTADIGADKLAQGLTSDPQAPGGKRGIRFFLERPELFKVQLRALYRAAASGNLAILLPMVNSVQELRRVRALIRQAWQELERRGAAFRPDAPLGVMIETPAAALLSEALAREADFFSIGTNDLTQYTLAMDRQEEEVSAFGEEGTRAVLHLIAMTVRHARRQGIPVCVCGEMGGDPSHTADFIRMGIREFSVAPQAVLPLKRAIARYTE